MRRRAWTRVLRWSLVVLAGITVLVLTALAVLLGTTAGARWVVSFGLSRSPVPVSIGSIEGTLRGPLVLEDIRIEREGLRARADRAVLDWRPLELLRRRVVIDSLHVHGLVADVRADAADRGAGVEAPPDAASGPPAVPELPVQVDVRSFRLGVERVTVEEKAEILASSLTGRGTPEDFELAVELAGHGGPIQEFEVEAGVQGSPEEYRLQADLSFTSEDLPPVTGSLEAAGSLTGIRIREARLETASGVASLTAATDWYPEIEWDVAVEAEDLEVAPFTPDPAEWPGAVSFRASSAGRMTDAGPEGSISVGDLGGELRGRRLGGRAEARAAPGRVDIDTVGLSWGRLRLDAAGVVDEELDLTFELEAPDLGAAVPGGEGSVSARGALSGTRSAPRIEADLEAAGVRVGTVALDRASGDVQVDLSPGASSEADLTAAGLSLGELVLDSLSLAGSGTREAHSATVRAWGEGGGLEVSVAGGVSEGTGEAPTWLGSLDSLLVSVDPVGEWRLAAPASVVASADSASLEEACLTSGDSEICALGSWFRDGRTRAEYRIVTVPLNLLDERLPDGMTVDGFVEGEGRLSVGTGGELSGEGSLRANGGLESRVRTESYRFRIGGRGIEFILDETGARASLEASLTRQNGPGDFEINGTVELPGYASTRLSLEDRAVLGGLEIRSDDLSFLAAFSPDVENAAGSLRIEADISGTVAEPDVVGRLALTDGAFDLPELGLEVREVGLTGSGEPGGDISISGSLRSGEGRVEVEARTPALPSPDSPAEIRVSGERFLAIGTPEIRVEIAPELEVRYDGEITRVEGRVDVPWARIELVEVPPSAVSPSKDVVFVDEEALEPPAVDARVEIRVGDDVRFDGLGFGSFIEGELRVREEPGREPVVLGELRFIDGRYTAYGQNLDIDPGRIVFTGPVEDATLDVTALRTASDGTEAGFIVTGSIQEPDIRITSDPAMTDVEALSYIMYGTNLNEGDASQQEAVTGAVATLGANVLTTQLAGKVGLDEARIEGTTKEQAEFVAGKYLTPSLFVSYGIGLFKPTNTFRIKYLLSSHWALQAESGDANGGDVLYQVELGGIGSLAESRD